MINRNRCFEDVHFDMAKDCGEVQCLKLAVELLLYIGFPTPLGATSSSAERGCFCCFSAHASPIAI